MANIVSSERRRYRPFFIIGPPVLFLFCIGTSAWVLTTSQDVRLAAPFVVASFGPARMMRWAMVWLSTPEERKLLARNMEREPVLRLIGNCFGRQREQKAEGKRVLPDESKGARGGKGERGHT
jgi:hypothetical protein